MEQYLFRNVNLLDPRRDELIEGHELLVEGDRICEVSGKPIRSGNAQVVDGGGRTLMPPNSALAWETFPAARISHIAALR